MWIEIGSAKVTANDVRIVGVPPFLEVQLSGAELIISDSPLGKLWVRSATGSILLTESAVNAAISAAPLEKVRDLDLKTYNGFIRISGRQQIMGAIWVPFTITAAPEIESGVRLRFAVRDINVAGAVPIPSFVVHSIAAKINERIGEAFDVTRSNLPIRLTGVTVDPGRLTLSASLEMPPESAPQKEEEELDLVPSPVRSITA